MFTVPYGPQQQALIPGQAAMFYPHQAYMPSYLPIGTSPWPHLSMNYVPSFYPTPIYLGPQT